MSCYQNNQFAKVVQSRLISRGCGMADICVVPYVGPANYGPDGRAELLHVGAGYYEYVAPGFEYCLDAPMSIPAGSMKAGAFQPYMD